MSQWKMEIDSGTGSVLIYRGHTLVGYVFDADRGREMVRMLGDAEGLDAARERLGDKPPALIPGTLAEVFSTEPDEVEDVTVVVVPTPKKKRASARRKKNQEG